MTALMDNQPFVMWSPFLSLYVGYRYGYWATGDDHFEAAEMWEIIYNMGEGR